ncbi:MAG: hypothetical protein OEX00_11040, partial [Gammaproteobacteria bacterium]|nr:hypothetical protein [Gammaproteobacteria bacterium]
GVRDNPAFDVRMDGFGLKLDYQGESDQGWFAGVDLDRTRERYSRAGFDSKATRQSLLLGMRGGYRYAVNKQLFVSPWFGMSANIGDKSRVQIGDEHYTPAQWQPFATMHVGMVF